MRGNNLIKTTKIIGCSESVLIYIKNYKIPDDIDPTKFSRNLRITRKKFFPEWCVLIDAIVLRGKAIQNRILQIRNKKHNSESTSSPVQGYSHLK